MMPYRAVGVDFNGAVSGTRHATHHYQSARQVGAMILRCQLPSIIHWAMALGRFGYITGGLTHH